MARGALTLALAGLVICAPSAYAQEPDVARGTATRISGAETTTYEIEAASGPLGENATGLITRTFTGPFMNSAVVADVTCLAVTGNRAVIIGRVRPEATVGIGAEAVLIRIEDVAPAVPPLPPEPDRVSFGVEPREAGEITFTGCASFLGDPFPTQPITAGDFQVIDGAAPPPPPVCDDDGDDDGGDDDDDDGGGDDDDDCDD